MSNRVMVRRLNANYVGGKAEDTGFFRLKIETALPSNLDHVLFVNPDARGGSPIYADANSEFAGPIWDIHVFDKNGNSVDPYYLDLQLVAD